MIVAKSGTKSDQFLVALRGFQPQKTGLKYNFKKNDSGKEWDYERPFLVVFSGFQPQKTGLKYNLKKNDCGKEWD